MADVDAPAAIPPLDLATHGVVPAVGVPAVRITVVRIARGGVVAAVAVLAVVPEVATRRVMVASMDPKQPVDVAVPVDVPAQAATR